MRTTDLSIFCPENVLDALPRGALVTELDWRIRYVNRTLTRAVKCAAGDLVGEPICSVAGKIGVVDSLREMADFLNSLTQNPPKELQVRTVRVQIPEKKSIRVTVLPFVPNGSETAGYVLSFVDFTREAGIGEMKDHFISDASHELRTPMTSIKGSLELLLGGYAGELPESATELLGICLTAVDRLIRLVNELLDIAKIEAGEMELHRAAMNVMDSVARCVRGISSLAAAQRVGLEMDAAAEIPKVMGDRDRLEQVITNLLSNAIKYSPPDGKVRILVRSGDGKVRVSVVDTGPGIPAAQVARVFDRFHQLAGAKKGTGLGLTISRALVEQHGGRIWLESEFGQGTTFHFELPALESS